MAGRGPAKPHARVKAERRVLSPDERWAAEISERILADCHPYQRDATEDPSRRVSILGGRGGAKTTTLRCRAARKVTSIREAEILYLARTKEHAKKLYWNPLQRMNEHYGLELRFKESDQTATCARTGGIITIKGMEDDSDIEVHRGYPFNEVQVDEAASHPVARVAKLLYEIVGPRLGERQGCIALAGSAGFDLKGDFYDATFPGSIRHAPYAERNSPGYERKQWSSHHWTAKMVAELPRARELYPAIVANWEEALVEKAENLWSDDNPIWLREYLAQWAANDTVMVFHYRAKLSDDTPWNQWDPFEGKKLEGIQGLEIAVAQLRGMGLADLRYVYGGDMGTALPYALNVYAFSPRDPKRGIWHVMFFERTRMRARLIAELHMGPEAAERAFLYQPPEPYAGVLGITGWPDAQVMDTDLATLEELTRTYGLPYKKAERNPNYKKGAIELVNGGLIDGQIHVIKNSPLEAQLTSLQWRENRFGHVEEDQRQASHSSDTLVYARKEIAGLFESGAVVQETELQPGPRQPQPVASRDPGIYPQPRGGGLSSPMRPVDPWRKL
jgi:hypothetical protein